MMVFDGVHPPVRHSGSVGRPQRPDPDLLDGQDAPPLLGQLLSGLCVRVEEGEVGDDDRNGQRYGQHAGQRAKGADQHPHVGLRSHVSVAHGRHGDQGPPETLRDAREVVLGVCLQALGVVDERRENDDAEDEKKDEQEKLFSTCLECVDQDLETPRMARQLKQPEMKTKQKIEER